MSPASRLSADEPEAASRLAAIVELEATSRLAAIVESSADAMIGKTLDGVITSWNVGAEQMYGYTADEIVGRNVDLLVPPHVIDELPAMLQRAAHGDGIGRYETERLRKDGNVFEAAVTISPIRDPGGNVIGASTVTQDITERKRVEADLRDLQQRLHQAERLESVGRLAGGIAHDFNNLLAGIMNYSTLVANGLADLTTRHGLEDDETVASLGRDVAEIANVATRAARLTHQLLIFSRREVFKPEVLDLNSIVVDMDNLLRRTIGPTNTLETELAPDLLRITGDRSRVEQVLMNLAVNARDAMTDGGRLRIVTARCEVDDADARIRAISRGEYVCLTVSDTGLGMRQEVADRAFEPFFTTKFKSEGNGMGLATVYGIVTDAGGEVVISSQPGRGTQVEITLPATDEMMIPATDEPVGTVPIPPHSATILLVEDEEIVREPTRRILVHSGYRVLAACDAEEAIRIAAEHPDEIELLLTDVVMPGKSGKELADHLARTSPQTKVLYMSGYTSDVIGFRAMSDDGIHLIEKPFAAQDLLHIVREVLDTD